MVVKTETANAYLMDTRKTPSFKKNWSLCLNTNKPVSCVIPYIVK